MLILAALLIQSSPTLERCLGTGDAAAGVQSAMQACIASEYAVQDARLNRAYAMRIRTLPAPRKPVLRSLQRRWIAARDRRCRLEGNGSLDRYVASACLVRETAGRTRWLQRYR